MPDLQARGHFAEGPDVDSLEVHPQVREVAEICKQTAQDSIQCRAVNASLLM